LRDTPFYSSEVMRHTSFMAIQIKLLLRKTRKSLYASRGEQSHLIYSNCHRIALLREKYKKMGNFCCKGSD